MSEQHGRQELGRQAPLDAPLAQGQRGRITSNDALGGPSGDMTVRPSGSFPTTLASRSSQLLLALDARLSDRDRALTLEVGRLGLLTSIQIERLVFSAIPEPVTRSRRARRALRRLAELTILHPLRRRIGGARAGSQATVYRLAPTGQRLVAYWRGDGIGRQRTPHEPGLSHLQHRLACSQLYVDLVEAAQSGRCELLVHEAEPQCWRPYATPLGGRLVLRPDAYVRVAADGYEHHAFVEVDRGTEGTTALRRKYDAYLAYLRTGREQAAHGVVPRVLWLTTSRERVRVLRDVELERGSSMPGVFATGLLTSAVDAVCGGGAR